MIGWDEIGDTRINGWSGFLLRPSTPGIEFNVPYVRPVFEVPPGYYFEVPEARTLFQVPHAHHQFEVPGEDP